MDGPETLRFDEWIGAHTRGELNDEITNAVAEVAEQVRAIGKPGKVLVELRIETVGKSGNTVAISGYVTSKPPRPASEASVFYVGTAGALHRDDPKAIRLPGVAYADAAGEIKVIDPESGEIRKVEDEDEGTTLALVKEENA